MKKMVLMLLMVALLSSTACAFLYEIKMFSAEEIKNLNNAQLIDVYTEAKIEERASSEFHISAGFSSAKEYEKRKELMRFIVNLRKEMSKREIVPDPIEDWLK